MEHDEGDADPAERQQAFAASLARAAALHDPPAGLSMLADATRVAGAAQVHPVEAEVEMHEA